MTRLHDSIQGLKFYVGLYRFKINSIESELLFPPRKGTRERPVLGEGTVLGPETMEGQA